MKELLKSREAAQILISLVLFIIAIIIPFQNVWFNSIVYIISYLVIGLDIVINAIKNIFKGEIFDENFLMSIATIGALIIGEFPEAVAVMLLYKIGELFQDYAVDKSKESISDLMNIRPDYAKVKREVASEKIINQKIKEVEELAEKINQAKVVLLTDYRGINVEDVTGIRAKLRGANTEYRVIKNNITRRALEKCGFEGLDELLAGPTAVVLGYEDYLEPSKVIYEYSKDNENYKIKGGIIEGKVVSAEEIITLAKLPSRETLIAQLAGALLGNVTKLAVALDQVRTQRENA